jgi:Cytochrome c554 and c-prime
MPAYLCRIKKQNYIIILLLLLVYAGTLICSGFNAKSKTSNKNILSDSLYAGSLSCKTCHKAIYNKFINTAHDLTSRPAAGEFIKGSFDSGQNHFTYNKFMEVILEKKDSVFFQTAYISGTEFRKEPIDIVIGSGRKGQTYLYWKENILYQLPVSYYRPSHSWCNSPGYPKNMIRFDRVTTARCIECHGSFAVAEDGIDNDTNSDNNITYFDKSSIVYGVNCERCHGPSANHVIFHTAHPEEKKAKYILTKTGLSRQQKLDVCALCHSGIRIPIKPPFSFAAGDKLIDYSLPKYNADSLALLDVHGNQYGLLASSKCFKSSEMNCSSCHNVHQTEINQPAVYSAKCMNCHNKASNNECTIKPEPGLVISNNCIDCHMPALPSKAIFLQLADPQKSTPDYVRTHRVAIYSEISREFIRKSKKAK